ncbi:MAG TPA: FAD-binding protein, partial [Candidatus Edwardsbacteria bacterium]|nr:FAD-binding protein [Candidatus Edwardsbacteria bacterium]
MKRMYQELVARLDCDYKPDEPLARHTSFRIGGPADLMLFPRDEAELSDALREVRRAKLRLLVLGNGTNMLAGDKGFRGVAIKLAKGFTALERSGNELGVDAALSLPRLVTACWEHGLTGMEWAVGIPGSVGG